MREYITKVKTLCDLLSAAGQKISENEHVFCLLNGLDEEYEFIVTFIASKKKTPPLAYVHSTLLSHEARVEQKKPVTNDLSINYASQTKPRNQERNNAYRNDTSTNQRGGQNFRGRGRGGRFNNNNRLRCQICEKFGHIASKY